jgi:hypothetical protein
MIHDHLMTLVGCSSSRMRRAKAILMASGVTNGVHSASVDPCIADELVALPKVGSDVPGADIHDRYSGL